MAVLAKENEARRQAGISAAGEGPDTLPFVVDLRGVNQFYELADRLQKKATPPAGWRRFWARIFYGMPGRVGR